MSFIVRNDDVAFDTGLQEIRIFCELCDRYGFTPLHAITPIGAVRNINAAWDNDRIRRESGNRLFLDNAPVVDYLRSRQNRDLFAVHGLWHTHIIRPGEMAAARELIPFDCGWFVPPFNEKPSQWFSINGRDVVAPYHLELTVSGKECPRLEEYLGNPGGLPLGHGMAYLHSWRFEHGPFTWAQLDRCMKTLAGRLGPPAGAEPANARLRGECCGR
jgi:hypothetical protein